MKAKKQEVIIYGISKLDAAIVACMNALEACKKQEEQSKKFVKEGL